MSAARSSDAEGISHMLGDPLQREPSNQYIFSVNFLRYLFMDKIRKVVFIVPPKAFKCSLATPIYMDGVGA